MGRLILPFGSLVAPYSPNEMELKMKLNWILNIIVAATTLLLLSQQGYAKKSKRRGFNFGSSFSFNSGNENGFASDDSPTQAKVTESGSSVSPYLGYVMGEHLNLGMSFSFADSSRHEIEKNDQDGRIVNRDKTSSLRSMSIFSRFLFGQVMFMEAGFGVYDQRIAVVNEYTANQGGGAFTGQRDEYKLRGVGTGYHFGAGVEIPIDNGFYFTAAYNTQTYNLRVFKGAADLGPKLGINQRRVISFGLSHFLK